MKPLRQVEVLTRILFAVIGVSASCVGIAAGPQLAYTLTPVEDPSTPTTLYVSDLNNNGEIVGTVETFGVRAFLWRDGHYIDLGNVIDPTAINTDATGINDHSAISGNRDTSASGFILHEGRRTEVSVPGGASRVNALNNRDQVIGTLQGRPFVWHRGKTTFLEELPGTDIGSMAVRINDWGVVVGTSGPSDRRTAVLWKHGTVMDLGLPADASRTDAQDINNWEQVVVRVSSVSGLSRGFLWDEGELTELPLLFPGEALNVTPWAINDWGAVVGTTFTGLTVAVATLWIGERVFDLNTLIASDDPLKAQFTLEQAYFINNRWQIVATGRSISGGPIGKTFLLKPVIRW